MKIQDHAVTVWSAASITTGGHASPPFRGGEDFLYFRIRALTFAVAIKLQVSIDGSTWKDYYTGTASKKVSWDIAAAFDGYLPCGNEQAATIQPITIPAPHWRFHGTGTGGSSIVTLQAANFCTQSYIGRK